MPAAPRVNSFWLFCLLIGCSLQLSACANPAKPQNNNLSAEAYRQQTYHFIAQKRYADGAKSLQQAIRLETRGQDQLLLGDLQEALADFKAARKSYQQGLTSESTLEVRQLLRFHAASLDLIELNRPQQAAELLKKLPADSAAAHNLQAARQLLTGKPTAALQHTEQVLNNQAADQEMIGWAHYHAARAWVAVNNRDKAFQALFFAINHARGHGLVSRISQLWEELKRQDRNTE